MGLIEHYLNNYLDKFKAKWGDKVYIEAHFDGRCMIKSEADHSIVFECKSFTELMDKLG